MSRCAAPAPSDAVDTESLCAETDARMSCGAAVSQRGSMVEHLGVPNRENLWGGVLVSSFIIFPYDAQDVGIPPPNVDLLVPLPDVLQCCSFSERFDIIGYDFHR